jgi:hypothetical protein
VGGYVGEPGEPTALLPGAYDEAGELRYMGAMRTPKQGWGKAVSELLIKLSTEKSFATEPMPGRSRWESHRFDEWFPVTPKIVCEVAYSRLDGGSFGMAPDSFSGELTRRPATASRDLSEKSDSTPTPLLTDFTFVAVEGA